MQNVLPCGHCRENLKRNFKAHPLKMCNMKNRDAFSRYIYKLHETVNKMLNKKSDLVITKCVKDMNIFVLVVQRKNQRCLILGKRVRKKKDAQNHYMEKNQNV